MYYHPKVRGETASKRADELGRVSVEPPVKQSADVRRVLVPVDGSSVALRAIAHLIDAENASSVKVHLVNVQPRVMQGDFALNAAVGVERRARLAAAREALDRPHVLLEEAGIRCETRLVFSDDPAETIARYAREHECDAILMGTRGLGSLQGLLRGSVATKVVSLADVPVTLVKHVAAAPHLRTAAGP